MAWAALSNKPLAIDEGEGLVAGSFCRSWPWSRSCLSRAGILSRLLQYPLAGHFQGCNTASIEVSIIRGRKALQKERPLRRSHESS